MLVLVLKKRKKNSKLPNSNQLKNWVDPILYLHLQCFILFPGTEIENFAVHFEMCDVKVLCGRVAYTGGEKLCANIAVQLLNVTTYLNINIHVS